jgi:uncharacterized protein YceK
MIRAIVLLLALALAGCGSMRSTTSKVDASTKIEEAIKEATLEKASTKTDKATTIVTTTTEKADTTIKVPGSLVTATKPLDAVLIEGLKAEDNGHRIVVTFDPVTKSLKATAERDEELHEVTIDKTTTSTTFVDEQTTKDEAKAATIDAKTTTESEISTVDKQKERSGVRLPWWVWLILIALVVYVVGKRIGY